MKKSIVLFVLAAFLSVSGNVFADGTNPPKCCKKKEAKCEKGEAVQEEAKCCKDKSTSGEEAKKCCKDKKAE